MVIYSLFFYIFALLLVVSSLIVVSVKNPVHSVLWLIFAFFNAAGLFILLGAEFIAMTLVIVYVGAVAVLFLFIVMLLDINFIKLKEGFRDNLPLCILIALILLADLFLMVTKSTPISNTVSLDLAATNFSGLSNSHALGSVLYTKYAPVFLIAGLILFVAMISAIILTNRTKQNIKRQNAFTQYNRSVQDSVKLVQVEIGKGVEQ